MIRDFDPTSYGNDAGMYCATKEESDAFRLYLHSIGRHWSSGKSYEHTDYWSGKGIVYLFNDGAYSSRVHDTVNPLLRYSDFDWDEEQTSLSCTDSVITLSFDQLFAEQASEM